MAAGTLDEIQRLASQLKLEMALDLGFTREPV